MTTVGATYQFAPEVVAFDPRNGFAPGGGLSNYFPRPAYQNPVVPKYLASLRGEFDGLYNRHGRAYPDIAAQGEAFVTIWNGSSLLFSVSFRLILTTAPCFRHKLDTPTRTCS